MQVVDLFIPLSCKTILDISISFIIKARQDAPDFIYSVCRILPGRSHQPPAPEPSHFKRVSLIVVMTSLAVLYLLLGAEFLAIAQIIVYAGAIMVLFTFVVMLLNAGREDRTMGSRTARSVGFPAVVVIVGVIATVILRAQGLGMAGLQDGITSTEDLSAVLFTELLLPFEVTSVLILIAILGAVALARVTMEKGRPAAMSSLLSQEVPALLVSAVERGVVFAGSRWIPHQAQSDHRLHVH